MPNINNIEIKAYLKIILFSCQYLHYGFLKCGRRSLSFRRLFKYSKKPVQATKKVKVLDFSPIIRNDISNFNDGGVGHVNVLF